MGTNGAKCHILIHAKSSRHRKADKTKKDSSQTQLESILENDACHNVKCFSSSEIKLSTVNNESEPLSEYEKMLAEKRTENEEFLKSLHIDEIKHDAANLINSMKKRKPRELKERSRLGIQRASKRKKEHVDYSPSSQDLWLQPTEKSFEKTLKLRSEYGRFVEDFNEIIEADDSIVHTPVLYDNDNLRKLSLKNFSTRISSIAAMCWFPTKDLALAVADGSGSLSLSTFRESDLDFYMFPIHSNRISHLQCNPYKPSHLVSSGFDGKVLCCDMQAQKFSEVLNVSDRGCTFFDFISPSSYIVSLVDGEVIITDSREQCENPAYCSKIHSCHSHSIHTINVHPEKRDYFVTAAARDHYFHVWDLRQLGTPVISKTNFGKNIISAAFSPMSGKFLLSKSVDQICIFDCTSMTEEHMKPCSTFKYPDKKLHDRTRPVWFPNTDLTFACSFKNSPAIQIYDTDLNAIATISKFDYGLKKHFTFHPFQSALACATVTNKIYVSTSEFEGLRYMGW